jgi:hypothetical protein
MPVSLRFFCRLIVASIVACAAIAPLAAQNDPASRRAAIDQLYPIMIAALEAKNFGPARHIADQVILWEPQNPVHYYNLACIEAQAGGKRLPYAVSALELSVALGFDDVDHLKNDPDLVPLHSDPKFAELVRKTAYNALAVDAIEGIKIPAASDKNAPIAAKADEPAKPASPDFKDGVPVGLYFMTRFWISTRTLEKAAWYFAPDGTVYHNLEHGFSPEDLAAHAGRKGRAKAKGNDLEVTWSDGKKTTSDVERDGTGFLWDMGIFTAVTGFETPSEIVGSYEGGESLVSGGNAAAGLKRLELRPDDTFTWEGVSFVGTTTSASRISAGGSGTSKGRWSLSGFSLTLVDDTGATLRRIVFPYDDAKTAVKPDRIFFGGLMYKKQ